MSKLRLLNCDEGRRRGCGTFCCRLLVRLSPEEQVQRGGARFVDKDDDGHCIHFDAAANRCTDWDNRPAVCREYDCNDDPLLPIVLRDGFTTLTALVTARHDRASAVDPIPAGDGNVDVTEVAERLADSPAPDEVGPVERRWAIEQQRLKDRLSDLMGAPEACRSCARGLAPPAGLWDGGRCCSHAPEVLFGDECVDQLRAGGVEPAELRGPAHPRAGCPFRGATGCALPVRCRPSACLSYICDELAAELDARGVLGEIKDVCAELELAAANHSRARALRQLAEELDDLL